MIEKIGHYALTTPASVYDEEAMTALELAGRTAQKVNEAIDQVNENENQVILHGQEVDVAKRYMVDNLPVFVNDKVEDLQEDGSLETMLVQAVSSQKMDKGAVGSVTYAMLAQDVREAITGGNTPVVGEDAVSTVNIVNQSVTNKKLEMIARDHVFHYTYTSGYSSPVVTVDSTAGTAVANTGAVADYLIIPVDGRHRMTPSTLGVVYEKTVDTEMTDFYWDPDSNVIYVSDYHSASYVAHHDKVYLGGVTSGFMTCTNIIPVTINGVFCPAVGCNNPPREEAHLAWTTTTSVDGANVHTAYIDYVNKRIVFPNVAKMYILHTQGGTSFTDYTNMDVVVDFSGFTGWCHLLADEKGLKVISNTNLGKRLNGYMDMERWWVGSFHASGQIFRFNFPCEKMRTVSILGDSVSTYAGYIPDSNRNYYTGSNDGVTSPMQTWWGRVMSSCGLALNTNNSYSGARVSNTHESYPSGMTLANSLDNGTDPDIILVHMGYNDFNYDVPLGDYTGKGIIPTDGSTFSGAYAIMLQNVLRNYPMAQVYAMTLPVYERNSAHVEDPENNGNNWLSDYNDRIRSIADALGVAVIETASCGFNKFNMATVMGDYDSANQTGLHPNATGHNLIAKRVIQALKHSDY